MLGVSLPLPRQYGDVETPSAYWGHVSELTEIISYSGGLDTSTILAWLLEQQYEVV